MIKASVGTTVKALFPAGDAIFKANFNHRLEPKEKHTKWLMNGL
jgi:hypothetical protein